MSTITFQVNSEKKEKLKALAQEQGVTVTFLLNQLIDYFEAQKLKFSLVKEEWDDTIMTEENLKQYKQAKKDLENGENIVSQEELYAKYYDADSRGDIYKN